MQYLDHPLTTMFLSLDRQHTAALERLKLKISSEYYQLDQLTETQQFKELQRIQQKFLELSTWMRQERLDFGFEAEEEEEEEEEGEGCSETAAEEEGDWGWEVLETGKEETEPISSLFGEKEKQDWGKKKTKSE